MDVFGSAHAAVLGLASWGDAGIPARCVEEFKRETWRQRAGLDWSAAKTSGCGILLRTDDAYPGWLETITDAPSHLYFDGDVSLLGNVAVAVVGMRKCSREGLAAAVQIARGLSDAGVTVVSGMAMGIDRAAHLAGLEGPGSSIGVLGAGVDTVYPAPNADVYALMREKGLLLSEYAPGTTPEPKHFPVRNRIVSGLARAVVVVEAAMRSGSLNTASHALEQNRDLMAVPGPASAASARGCQELVRKGAKPVFCADDVLAELVPHLEARVHDVLLERDLARFRYRGEKDDTEEREAAFTSPLREACSRDNVPWLAKKGGRDSDVTRPTVPAEDRVAEPAGTKKPPVAKRALRPVPELAGTDASICELLRKGPMHIDDICRSLGQNAGSVSRALTMLEIKGIIARSPGMVYALAESH